MRFVLKSMISINLGLSDQQLVDDAIKNPTGAANENSTHSTDQLDLRAVTPSPTFGAASTRLNTSLAR